MSLWSPDESDELDRQVRESRKRESRERAGTPAPVTHAESRRAVAAGTRYITDLPTPFTGGRPRHQPARTPEPTTPTEQGPTNNRRPTPRYTKSGRWTVISKRGGKWKQRTFDTEAEAQAWLDQMINSKENP